MNYSRKAEDQLVDRGNMSVAEVPHEAGEARPEVEDVTAALDKLKVGEEGHDDGYSSSSSSSSTDLHPEV